MKVWELTENKLYKVTLNGKEQQGLCKLKNGQLLSLFNDDWISDRIKFNDAVKLDFVEYNEPERNKTWHRYIFSVESPKGSHTIHIVISQENFEKIAPKNSNLINKYTNVIESDNLKDIYYGLLEVKK